MFVNTCILVFSGLSQRGLLRRLPLSGGGGGLCSGVGVGQFAARPLCRLLFSGCGPRMRLIIRMCSKTVCSWSWRPVCLPSECGLFSCVITAWLGGSPRSYILANVLEKGCLGTYPKLRGT